jgi:alpha-aminoadipic semialdehyde synthase
MVSYLCQLRPARRLLRVPVAARGLSTTPSALATLGLRREDPRRVWERRAPLTPEAIAQLAKENTIEVESCARRCFPDAAYEAVS